MFLLYFNLLVNSQSARVPLSLVYVKLVETGNREIRLSVPYSESVQVSCNELVISYSAKFTKSLGHARGKWSASVASLQNDRTVSWLTCRLFMDYGGELNSSL